MLAKKVEEPKDKREAPSSYPQLSGQSSVAYQAPSSSLGHGDASSISIGAGYSIGGAKPSFSFGGQTPSAGLQYSGEGLSAGHGGAIQLAPITLQPGQDLSQIMSQLQQSLGAAALTLQPSNNIAEYHEGNQGAQGYSFPQFQQYAAPQYQQYQLGGQVASAPSYSAGTKGLSSYGHTGPVLFNPQEHGAQQSAFSYPLPSGGHASSDAGSLSFGSAGLSQFPGLSLGGGHSLGSAGTSLPGSGYSLAGLGGSGLSFDGTGYSFGGAGHPLGSSAQALGGAGYTSGSSHGLVGAGSLVGSGHSVGSSEGHSLGGPGGHSLGGSGSYSYNSPGSSHGGTGHSFGSGSSSGAHYKVLNSGKPSPGKTSFKPSTFLGASIPSESSSYSSSSFPGFPGSHSGLSLGGHGHSFPSFASYGGASKQISPLYTKSEGSLDSAGAYSSSGHLNSPPGTTYGFPTSSYSTGITNAASSSGPQYYISSSKYPASFGEGSSSYKSPGSSHSALSSHSGPKYSFGSHSSRYPAPKDSHGAYSETTYNTIKYSEEFKPRIN